MSDSSAIAIEPLPRFPEQIVDPGTGRASRQMLDWINGFERWTALYLTGELGALPQATLARSEAASAKVEAEAAAKGADVAASNSAATSTGGAGALMASLSSNTALPSTTPTSGGTASASVTLNISGGTAPYAITLTRLDGYTYASATASPNPLTADGPATLTWTDLAAVGNQFGTYQVTVTDSAGSPDTINLTVSVATTVLNAQVDY